MTLTTTTTKPTTATTSKTDLANEYSPKIGCHKDTSMKPCAKAGSSSLQQAEVKLQQNFEIMIPLPVILTHLPQTYYTSLRKLNLRNDFTFGSPVASS